MAKEYQPAGSQWKGLQKHLDPADIPEDASPDCENAYFWEGIVGLLAPRRGKTQAGYANQTITGVYPYHVNGLDGILLATADGGVEFLSGYGSAVPAGSLNPPSQVTLYNQTLNLGGPIINLQINQFGQIIGGQAVAGLSGTLIICALDDFDQNTCQFTYTKVTLVFVQGVLTTVTVANGQGVCASTWTPA